MALVDTCPRAGTMKEDSDYEALKDSRLVLKTYKWRLEELLLSPVKGIPGLGNPESDFLSEPSTVLEEATEVLVGRYELQSGLSPQSTLKWERPTAVTESMLACLSCTFTM